MLSLQEVYGILVVEEFIADCYSPLPACLHFPVPLGPVQFMKRSPVCCKTDQ